MNGIPLKSDCQIRRHVPIRALLKKKKKLLRHSSAQPSGWMLSSRSQLNQDIIQNAQGELTCWPTFDKLRGTHDSFSSFIFIQITTTSPNETKCIMLENTGTEEWFLSTQRIRKAEYAGTLVWYCAHWTEPVIQQCIQQVGWKLKKKRKTPSIMPPLRMSSLRSRLPWCISVWKGDVRWLEEICMCINSGKHQAEHTII